MKTLIKNGMLIDGTGAPGTPGDLLMEGERIVAVGRLESPHADVVVDAAGLAVAPGFIDTHSHSDLEVFKEPELAPKLRQGITTEILGQDGISMAPLPQQFISPWRKNLAGLDGDKDDLDWTYGTTENYLNLLEKNGSGTNLCYLVPHGNVAHGGARSGQRRG